jgi:hypothetical protein
LDVNELFWADNVAHAVTDNRAMAAVFFITRNGKNMISKLCILMVQARYFK